MARKRMISPAIWEDPGFNKFSIGARLLFIGIISNADDEGYIRGELGSLRRLVFGFDDNISSELEKWIDELKHFRNLHFYRVGDECFAHLLNWDKYQKQQRDRIQESEYPKCSICYAGGGQVRKEVSKEVSRLSKGSLAVANATARLAKLKEQAHALNDCSGALTKEKHD